MAISAVSISNRALDLLGIQPIISFEDGTRAANLCQRNYPIARDLVLRSYPWNSAITRATLPALLEDPAWGYAYQYPLPQGPDPARCLRVLKVERVEEYKIEGRYILCNSAPPVRILYIGQISDPAQFDPLLAEAIAGHLATYLAANLTESAGRIAAVQAYLKDVLSLAKSVDAQEGTAEDVLIDEWLRSRI